MNKKNFPFQYLFGGIFLLVGIAMLAAGIIFLVSNRRFRERAEEVTAIISDIRSYRGSKGKRRHSVSVSYTYNGMRFEGVPLNFYSSSMYEGKEITLLCDPENPGHVESPGGMLFITCTFMGMGILFIIIGTVPIIHALKGSARKKKLLRSGRKLWATVEDITQNTSYRVNGRHPYVIYCAYRDEGLDMAYRFKSDNIWTNPHLAMRIGDTVPVYVDGKNFQFYYVDVDSSLGGKIVDYT